MKKTISLFVLLAIVGILFRQFFLHGLLPIPSDALVGLYHPFRDLYASSFPRGIPFKNFLITDPIRQLYPWRELVISMEKQLQLPLWNPYSFSGYPLLANFQSAAFYPLNIFFFILPFVYAWSFLVFLQPLLAAVFLYLYLRHLKLQRLAAILGSISFAFSGFSVAWLEWNTILQTILWLPLMLLTIDKLLEKWSLRWGVVLIFAGVSAVLAGHIQMLFYVAFVVVAYLFARILQKVTKQKIRAMYFFKAFLPFAVFGIVIAVITAIQWVPTMHFIFLSARSIDVNYLTAAGWFVPWQHLLQFVFPDFFGNPTTLNYWGVWNYGEFVGYIGILPLLLALFAFIRRRDKKTYFFSAVCFLALLLALPTLLAKLPYSLHIPFFSTAQPTRLMGIIDFSLAILAAFGMDMFIKNQRIRNTFFAVVGGFTAVFIAAWLFVEKYHGSIITPANLLVAKHNMIFPTLVFASSAFIAVLLVLFWKYIPQKARMLVFCVLILITAVDQLRFADKFTPFTPKEYLYPKTQVLRFLQQHEGNYRLMTTDSRILPPNVSDMYRLQSIEGYDPLYIDRYGAFIAAMQRNRPDISVPFGFNRIIVPHDTTSPLLNLLGVKYVLSFDNLSQKGLEKVFQEGQTIVYENTNVFARAFFVSSLITAPDQQSAISAVFANKNNLHSVAVVEGVKQTKTIGIGSATIQSYTPNRISITTENKNSGFLVLTDVYYPTWQATVDSKEATIFPTDFTFRGIFVPKGKHTIVFSDHLF